MKQQFQKHTSENYMLGIVLLNYINYIFKIFQCILFVLNFTDCFFQYCSKKSVTVMRNVLFPQKFDVVSLKNHLFFFHVTMINLFDFCNAK